MFRSIGLHPHIIYIYIYILIIHSEAVRFIIALHSLLAVGTGYLSMVAFVPRYKYRRHPASECILCRYSLSSTTTMMMMMMTMTMTTKKVPCVETTVTVTNQLPKISGTIALWRSSQSPEDREWTIMTLSPHSPASPRRHLQLGLEWVMRLNSVTP